MHTTTFTLLLLVPLLLSKDSNCLEFVRIESIRGSANPVTKKWLQKKTSSAFSPTKLNRIEIHMSVKNNGQESSERDNITKPSNIEKVAAPFLPFDLFGLSVNSRNPTFPIIILILALTRPIPLWDRFFSIAYPLYLCLANRFRFDRNAPSVAKLGNVNNNKLPLLREGSGPWFKYYLLTFGSIGIILPLILQIIAPSPIAGVAAPHLYLTLCQVLMETITRGPKFHSLTQLLVPIGFNAYRLSCLKTWLLSAYKSFAAVRCVSCWETIGLTLALSNTIIWIYNIFVFLLLRTLPQYLDQNICPDVDYVSWKGQLIPIALS